MTLDFEKLTQRLHAVMDTHGIPHSKDLSFLGEIIWVLGLGIDIKLVGKKPSPAQYKVADLELNARASHTLGRDQPISIIAEVLDDPDHPLRKKLRVRDIKEMQELRTNMNNIGVKL